jgi:hypothetical protein
MAAVTQTGDEAQDRLKAFFEKRTGRVEPPRES